MNADTAQCLCGNVGWQLQPPLEYVVHCHCQMCRKAHGSTYATYADVSEDAFAWRYGRDFVALHRASEHLQRAFCKHCGSVVPFSANGHMAIPVGNMDEGRGIEPTHHIFANHKAPWHSITDVLPQYGEWDEHGRPVVDRPPAAAAAATDSMHGSCLCAGVRYQLSGDWLAVYNCHCLRCRRARSAAVATNGFIAADGFRFLCGESLLRSYKLPDAKYFTQVFCRDCGSPMPRLNRARGVAVIPFGSLDDDPKRQPDCHIYVQSRALWDTITDALPQYAEGPPR